MKRMAILLIASVVAIAFIIPGNSFAQETRGDIAIGGAVTLALPFGGLGDHAGMGFGLDGIFEYGWNENITAIGTAGFLKWGSKETDDILYSYKWNYSTYKIVGGAKYYFKPGKSGWYGGAEVGFHIYSYSWEWEWLDVKYDDSGSSTDFSISPMGGYEMPMGDSGMRWSFSGVLAWAGDMYIGVRVGLIYPLSKGQTSAVPEE